MAATTDLITQVVSGSTRPVATTVTATRSAAGTTLTCAALTGWETATKVHFATYSTDASGDKIDSSQCDWSGIVSGSTITNLTLTAGTDVGNSIGQTVECMPTAAWADELARGILVSLNPDGTVKAGAVSSATMLGSDVVTTAKISNAAVTANKLATGAATAYVATGETTTSTSYVSLATATDTVTVTVGANGLALVAISYNGGNSGADGTTVMGFALSGANTLAAADNYSVSTRLTTATANMSVSGTFLMTGLTPGSTTFAAKYRVGAATGTFTFRRISVVPL